MNEQRRQQFIRLIQNPKCVYYVETYPSPNRFLRFKSREDLDAYLHDARNDTRTHNIDVDFKNKDITFETAHSSNTNRVNPSVTEFKLIVRILKDKSVNPEQIRGEDGTEEYTSSYTDYSSSNESVFEQLNKINDEESLEEKYDTRNRNIITESTVLDSTKQEIENILNSNPAITSLKYEFDVSNHGLIIHFIDGNIIAAVERLKSAGFSLQNVSREFDGSVLVNKN